MKANNRISTCAIGFFMCLGFSGQINAESMGVEMATTYTCSSNAECKRKCEGLGGRWKRDTTDTTFGTCTIPASSLSDLVNKSKAILGDEKNISKWTHAGANAPGIVLLTPSECDALGGDVDYHTGCSGTHLKCTTTNKKGERNSACIDKLDRFID